MEKEDFLFFGVVGLILVVLLILGGWGASISCHSRYGGLGDTRWGIVSGCLVEVEPGLWIPENSYYYRGELPEN